MDSGRIEKLQKFRDADEDSVPAVVCNDLAGRGLDLVCYHVINCDFPLNPIDHLHRTGRTACMGAEACSCLVDKGSNNFQDTWWFTFAEITLSCIYNYHKKV